MPPPDKQQPACILTVPGWKSSGPRHWQSLWEQEQLGIQRVQQNDWFRPRKQDWITVLHNAIRFATGPIVVVAHSLGCIALAHWAQQQSGHRIAGALLVAPPWFHSVTHCPQELAEFFPAPLAKLPFPSWLVASENDPYLPLPVAERLARAWGSRFINAGHAGHINAESGHGAWHEGKTLLHNIISSVKTEVSVSSYH